MPTTAQHPICYKASVYNDTSAEGRRVYFGQSERAAIRAARKHLNGLYLGQSFAVVERQQGGRTEQVCRYQLTDAGAKVKLN